MSNRHRRTRIYGANYDIGESYYKKQLNELDSRKEIRSNGSSFEMDTKRESKFSPKVTFLSQNLDFNDKNSNIIRKFNFDNYDDEDHTIQEKSTYKTEELDKEYIKGSPKTAREFSIDIDRYHKDFGNNSNRFLSKDDGPMNLEGETTSLATIRSKFFSDRSVQKGNIIEEVDASRRANVTKARLLDLEEQIMSVTNKQNEREKRNKDLKKLLSEVSSNST